MNDREQHDRLVFINDLRLFPWTPMSYFEAIMVLI